MSGVAFIFLLASTAWADGLRSKISPPSTKSRAHIENSIHPLSAAMKCPQCVARLQRVTFVPSVGCFFFDLKP